MLTECGFAGVAKWRALARGLCIFPPSGGRITEPPGGGWVVRNAGVVRRYDWPDCFAEGADSDVSIFSFLPADAVEQCVYQSIDSGVVFSALCRMAYPIL